MPKNEVKDIIMKLVKNVHGKLLINNLIVPGEITTVCHMFNLTVKDRQMK